VKGLVLEEAYEVIDALNAREFDAFEDELGDLLFQVVFCSRLAEEEGRFDFDAVAERVRAKLVRRHPHVFGEKRARTAEEALASWTAVKEKEANPKRQGPGGEKASWLDGIAPALPSTLEAHELGLLAAEAGFDWNRPEDVLEKAREEIAELEAEMSKTAADKRPAQEEIGDLLLTLASLARHLGTDAESCLRQANQKFKRRFQKLERESERRGRGVREMGAEELEKVWQSVKEEE
jgi:ATP diphosphatase